MPFRVAEKPGGVVTLSPVRFWSPSGRVSSNEKGSATPAVLSATPALEARGEGRAAPGQGDAFGAASSVKNWLEIWSGSAESHGVKVVSTA